jgi:hypothetical protein
VFDQVYGGTGANQHITTNGAQATVYVNVAGEANVLLEALGGGSTINVGNNGSVETVRLAGTSGNTVNIGLEAGANSVGNQLSLYGLTGSDIFNFTGAQIECTDHAS